METTNTKNSPFATLTLIYTALIFGQIVFLGIAFYNIQSIKIDISDTSDPFLYIVPSVGILAIFLSNLTYNRLILRIDNKDLPFKQKFANYQSACIARYAWVEAATLFAIVSYFILLNFVFLIFATILILYFITLKPNKNKIIAALKLNPTDQSLL
ncbi:hypothetical protein [Joostella sp.]|uniref:hypothetical protein n=1 Tax=Joostella sp. TaxID=2231138 RepID=UPI003A8F65E7